MPILAYSKTCVKRTLSKRPRIGFQDQLWLNAGQKKMQRSILQYFRPALSYHLSSRSLFCLFLRGHFTQVLLYVFCKTISEHIQWYPSGAFCNTFDLIKLPFVIKIYVLSIFEKPFYCMYFVKQYLNIWYEPWHQISNNVVGATSKASVFASRLNILWVLSYWPNSIWSF